MKKDYFLLKLLDRFRRAFEAARIDYPVMRKLLQLKLTLDERRVPTVMSRGQAKEGKSSFLSSMLLYAFIGLFIGLLILPPYPLYFKMNLVLGMILFMVMTTMISDFSSVLLDIKDKNILLTRPVNSRTLNAAKLIHIIYYLIRISVSISGVSLIVGLIRYGVGFFLLFLLELILICGFVILITSILYYAVLHFFSGEKLKDIINYFQIILSVFMMLMYQLVGRIYNISSFNIQADVQWWNFLLPSAWFAAPFSLILEHDFSTPIVWLTVVSIAVPLAALFLYVKAAAPAFERNLLKLNSSGGSGGKRRKRGPGMLIGSLICRTKTERTFYRFASLMMTNERKLKLKLYPSLAFAVIMPFIFLLSMVGQIHSAGEFFSALSNGRYYISLYFSAAFLCPSIYLLSMSENYKGAWIYRAMPVHNPAEVIRAAVKAYLFKFVIPVYLFAGLLFTILCGVRIFPDLVLIFLNMLVLFLFTFLFSKKELPFYKSFDVVQGSANTAVVFSSFALCGLFAAAHYVVLRLYAPGRFAYMGVSLIAVVLLWLFSFRITWKDVARDAA